MKNTNLLHVYATDVRCDGAVLHWIERRGEYGSPSADDPRAERALRLDRLLAIKLQRYRPTEEHSGGFLRVDLERRALVIVDAPVTEDLQRPTEIGYEFCVCPVVLNLLDCASLDGVYGQLVGVLHALGKSLPESP